MADDDDNRDLLAPASWITTTGFGFFFVIIITVNSFLAAYRARDDAGSVLFVLGSYLALLLLLASLRAFERARPGSPTRARARRAVWPLTTLLTAAFAWKVAALFPPAVAALVWGLAVATSVGGFYALFVHA